MSSFQFNPDEHVGWEQIWLSDDIPPRYRSFAPPNDTVVEWVEAVPSGGSILDVGCGVGRHLVYLGGRGFRVAGVDISPGGVRLAVAACAERHIAADVRASDMTTLPWADMTFDAALSTSAIHHQLRVGMVQTLAETWRVLKPGGLLLVDFPCTDTLVYQQLRRRVAAGELTEVEPATFVDEGPVREGDDEYLPHHFCDEADARDLLRDFEIIRLWADLHDVQSEGGTGKAGKWVAWGRKPLSG
ncbi:MAG: methyltransferase domain-containing protein [Anaerolineae bacterium]|nr:methyltransferase domain-containing protein [Anaerolineae bacterium]